jgi:uracil-DNA glycosylase
MTLFDVETSKDPRILSFIDKIDAGDWGFEKFFKTDAFYAILNNVFNEGWNGYKIHPRSDLMFRAFKECPYEDLKVVCIGQDPYYQNGVADGLAFSCGRTLREQPSLSVMLDEIAKTTGSTDRNPDLIRWARQGMLLFNTALTVREGSPDSHTQYWDDFVRYVIHKISTEKSDIVFVMFGRKAEAYSGLIQNGARLSVVHPAAAVRTKSAWNSKDVFNTINDILIKQGKSPIRW